VGAALSPAARIRLLVALAAAAAAAVVAGVVLATSSNPPQPKTQCRTAPQPLVVPGVRSRSVAGVRAAFAAWPGGTIPQLQLLARDHPSDPVVRFNYGIALLCKGYLADASTALAAAKSSGRDTYYEMRADELLHPQFFQPSDGLYPIFQPVGRVDPLLLRGQIAQRQGHQHTAERLYAKAARLHPDDDQAQVAAAVGLFDEDHLSRSFSRLGPLTKRFPRSQSAHFHLGLLAAWVGLRSEAATQFEAARRLGPTTSLGRQAAEFVARLVPNGTNGAKR
jgi:tetratricopeptide (TPR) repeat protein